MGTDHTTPATLSEALYARADLMDEHPTSTNYVTLANLMSRVLDGSGSAWKATQHPELAKEMTTALVPNGLLSPVPTVQQVREAAARSRKVATSLLHQVSTHSVRLRIDEQATIDLGHHPDYPRHVVVTELAVVYETTKSGTTVTSITYVLDDEEDKAAFVHPEYLGLPDEWPAWVRLLVDEHRPKP